MSLQWTLVAGFLYLEIGLVILLLLPFISATRWNSFFKSRVVSSFKNFSNLYFKASVAVLLLLFVDALRSQRHYSGGPSDETGAGSTGGPLVELQHHMKLFRAQRNLYIAGFALFLVFVIRRLVVLLANQATLKAESEAAMKQAKSAGDAAQRLLDAENNPPPSEDSELTKNLRLRLVETTGEHEKAQERVGELQEQLDALKRQAESTSEEYDRLLLEHTKLNKRLSISGKKDD